MKRHLQCAEQVSRTRRFGDLTRPILEMHFLLKNKPFRAPPIYQNFEVVHLPRKITFQLYQINIALATQNIPRDRSVLHMQRHL